MKFFQQPIQLVLVFLFSNSLANTDASGQSQPESVCINAIVTENFEIAELLCENLLKKAQQENKQESELSLLIGLVDIYNQTGKKDAFYDYLKKAEKHPLFPFKPEIQYKWLRLKAIKLHHSDDLELSSQLFTQALQIAKHLNDPLKIFNSNIDLGISTNKSGNYKAALKHYSASLELTKQINDPHAIGLLMENIGEVYNQTEDYDKASQYFLEALTEYQNYSQQKNHDQRVSYRITAVQENLVSLYQKSNNPTAANHFKQKIENSKAKLNNTHDQANQYMDEAKELMKSADFNQAATKLKSALKLYQSEGIEQPSEVLYLLAKSHQQLKQNELAIAYALEGIKETDNESAKNTTVSLIYQLLSQLYADPNPQLALEYANKYNQSREVFLAQKYNTDFTTIQHLIDLEIKQNKLVYSQLENSKQQVKIQTLNNKYLISLFGLLSLLALIIYLIIKKKREQNELTNTINYHRNQLAVLSLSTHSREHKYDEPNPLKIKQETVNGRLVDMMHDAVNLWVEHTGENLIELAHRSKIWTITNDNGTLRVRSLEKYLSLEKMPKNPRWRSVVSTCHFVLSESGLSTEQRHGLNLKLESLMQLIKDFYGTGK